MTRKGGGFTAPTKGTEKSSNSLGASVTIADYGDVEVKGVIDVDVSPLAGDINYDASENDLSVSAEIGLPGGVVGVGGGAIIDLDTGAIIGGSGSLGIGGAEVEVSISKCERTLQVTYWGIGFAISENTCEPEPKPGPDPGKPPIIEPPPGNDSSNIPSTSGFVIFESAGVFSWTIFLDNLEEWTGTQTKLDIFKNSYELPSYYSFDDPEKSSKSIIQKVTTTTTTSGTGACIDLNPPGQFTIDYLISYKNIDRAILARFNSFPGGLYSVYDIATGGGGVSIYYTTNMKGLVDWLNSTYPPENVIYDSYSTRGASPSNCSQGLASIQLSVYFKLVGFFPENPDDVSANVGNNSPFRRPIPPEIMDKQCCDASISLLRKIYQVLAVDQILEPDPKKKITTDTVEIFKLEYDKLTEQLALINKKPRIVFENYLQFKIYELAIGNKKIDQIHKVLRAEDLLTDGIPFPNELIVPGGTGQTYVKDYPNVLKKFVQIIDLNTIQPFTAVLQDSDPAKEGDQPLTKFFPDATSAIKEVVELLVENKVDSATRLNIQMRQSVLGMEAQVALLETLSIAYTILYGLGLPFHQKGSTFIAPFDISPDSKGKEEAKKKGKGFNPKNKQEEQKRQSAIDALNENREDATEKLLPDFLSTVKQEYLHTYFNDNEGKNESLWYYIMSVLMRI